MPRTITRNWSSFSRSNVRYTFTKDSKAHITTITIPPGSDWTSGLHWHESYLEFLLVKSGTAHVTIGSTNRPITAADGKLTIERGVIHEWRRDPNNSTDDLVVEEWTDPADGLKEAFFRNLCSFILDFSAGTLATPRDMPKDWFFELQLWLIFGELDNYPVLYQGPLFKVATYVVLRLARIVGGLLGVTARYREYDTRVGNDKED